MRKVLFYVFMHMFWCQIIFSYINDKEKKVIILTYEEASNIVNGIEHIAEQYRATEDRKQVRACYNTLSNQSSIPGICNQSSDTILMQLLTYAQAIKKELCSVYKLVSESQAELLDDITQVISQSDIVICSKINQLEQTLINEIEIGVIEATIAISDVFDQLTQSEMLLCSKIITLDTSILSEIADNTDIVLSEISIAVNDISQTHILICSKIASLDVSLVNQIEDNQDIILGEVGTVISDISQAQTLICSKIEDLQVLLNDIEVSQNTQIMADENNFLVTMSQVNRIEQILRGQLC